MIIYNSNGIKGWNYGDDGIVKAYYHNNVVYQKIESAETPSFAGKWIATYSDSSTSSAECDSTSAISQNEITLTNLTDVEIGDCVTSIYVRAFDGGGSLSSVTIPDSVTSIGDYAFSYGGLTSVTIPDSVTSIGNSAFQGCSSLTSITIPDSVTSIGNNAFMSCGNIASINIPSGVTSIGGSTFRFCRSLTSITIPDSVTSIGGFAFQNCYGLTSITVNATTPPTLGSSAFDGTNDCPIYVPTASVETYKTAWSVYASRIQAIA